MFGVEISTNKKVKILDKNTYLYFVAYVDDSGNEIHPNAIAWVAHKNLKLLSGV